MSKVCFITANYGNYEATCKKFVEQTIPTDFICFTDNPAIKSNGWTIDTNPYHLTHKSPLDNDSYVNSVCNNKHTFNVAKYYKQAFQNIPRLKEYDIVVWVDGTIEIIYDKVSEYLVQYVSSQKIITWHHEHRFGILEREVQASDFFRYTSTFWNNQPQPFQDVFKQYLDYIHDGYTNDFFKKIPRHTPHFGVWITCFVAFDNKDESVSNFLNKWFMETLTHTTQDQISFPYVCYKTNIIPMTLPNNEIHGNCPHENTMFYIKKPHGQ